MSLSVKNCCLLASLGIVIVAPLTAQAKPKSQSAPPKLKAGARRQGAKVGHPYGLMPTPPFWGNYGANAQHTAISPGPAQRMVAPLWHTAMDLLPPYSGSDLFIHYASPLITKQGNIILGVRTGPASYPTSNDTFQIEAHDFHNGALLYTETTDFTAPTHNWIPSCASTIDPFNTLYSPGAGGTVYRRLNADDPSSSVTRMCFYGIGTYNANTAALNSTIKVCTPLTSDRAGNVYFGFVVSGSNPAGLTSGIARISSRGVGSYVTADAASGFTGMEVATNAAPAVSNDGLSIYVDVKAQGVHSYSNPTLLRLDATTLATVSSTSLLVGNPSGGFSWVLDDGSASPMVGPDGDVYLGIWYNNLASRGFMLHYSGDLQTAKPAGAFGWDDTASIVPASAVPSYTGTSTYLLLTKYNNYADAQGDGLNKLAILDPNATESYTVQYGANHNPPNSTGPTYTVMKEVLTVLGPTPNTGLEGVREWCINIAAIDVANKSAIVNSEDGHCYRWDFTTNTLLEDNNLEPPTGEAYTPTIIGADGLAYAVNNAKLYAMWDGVKPASVTFNANSGPGGDSVTGTVTLSSAATGPGATVDLSSSDSRDTVPSTVLIPAGSTSVDFTIGTTSSSDYASTITAKRYYDATTNPTSIAPATLTSLSSELSSVSITPSVVPGGTTANGTVSLLHNAPSTGRTVDLSSDLTLNFNATHLVIAGGQSSATFTISPAAVASTVSGTITATEDDATTVTTPVTIHAAILSSLTLSSTGATVGSVVDVTVRNVGVVPGGGIDIPMTYSANVTGPATVHIGPSNVVTARLGINPPLAGTTNETISASFEGVTKSQHLLLSGQQTILLGFSMTPDPVLPSYNVTGTVTLSGATPGPVVCGWSIDNRMFTLIRSPIIVSGQSVGHFVMRANMLYTGSPVVTNVTLTYNGVSISHSITVNPLTLTSIGIAPSTITSGNSSTVTVTVAVAAGDGPLYVRVYSPSSALTFGGPYAIVQPGQTTATLNVTAATVTQRTRVPVYAYLGGTVRFGYIVIDP